MTTDSFVFQRNYIHTYAFFFEFIIICLRSIGEEICPVDRVRLSGVFLFFFYEFRNRLLRPARVRWRARARVGRRRRGPTRQVWRTQDRRHAFCDRPRCPARRPRRWYISTRVTGGLPPVLSFRCTAGRDASPTTGYAHTRDIRVSRVFFKPSQFSSFPYGEKNNKPGKRTMPIIVFTLVVRALHTFFLFISFFLFLKKKKEKNWNNCRNEKKKPARNVDNKHSSQLITDRMRLKSYKNTTLLRSVISSEYNYFTNAQISVFFFFWKYITIR